MAKAGAVWLPVLPDFSLFNKTSASELKLTMGKAGKTSGSMYGKAFAQSTKMSMAGMKQAIVAETAAATAEAEKIVRASSARLGAARKAEADAVGGVVVAEARLNDLRLREAARAKDLAAAEAHLSGLRKTEGVAASELATAEGRVNALRGRASANATSLVAAEERVAKAHRGEALAADKAKVAAGELATAQAEAATVASTAATRSAVASGRLGKFAVGGAAAFNRVGSAAKGMLKTTAKVGVGLGAFGLAEFAAHGIHAAGDFQKSMTLLVTAGGESKKALGLVGDGVMRLATQTGTSTDQLAEGMYTIEKAGFRAGDGLKILKASAQGAKAENVDLAVMTNAVTSAMTSYHLKAGDANMVTNEMVAAAGAAKTTMQTFAGSLSTVLPIASAAGISFAQVGGAIATLTNHGTSAEEATQELSNTIRNLQAPNNVAVNEMARFGIQANDVSSHLGKRGLTGTLEYLSDTVLHRMGPSGLVLLKTFNQSKVAAQGAQRIFDNLPPAAQKLAKGYRDGSVSLGDYRKQLKLLPGPQASLVGQFVSSENRAKGFDQSLRSGVSGSKTYVAAIKAMTGGANGLNTTLQLTGENTGRFNANVKAVSKAAKESGSNVSTWAATQKTFNVQLDQFKQGIAVAGIKLGTVLLPKLLDAGHYIAGTLYPAVKQVYEAAFKPLFSYIGAHSTVFKILAAAILIGVLALEAYTFAAGVAKARQAAFAKATLAQKVIIIGIAAATKVWAAAQWVFNAAMNGNVLVIVTLAIIALGAALVVAYKKSATFRAIVQGALHGVEAAASAVGKAFTWIKSAPLWAKILIGFGAGIAVVTVAIWAVNLAIEANPIVALITGIVIAIAALGYGIYQLVKHFNVIVNFFTHTLPNAFMFVFNFIKNSVPDWAKPFLGFIGIIALISEHWTGFKNIFTTTAGVIKSIAVGTWHVVTAIIRTAITVLKYAGEIIYAILALPFYIAFLAIRKVTTTVWGWIGPYVTGAIRALGRAITATGRAIRAAWSATWNAVKNVAKTIWNAISGFFVGAWNAFAGLISRRWHNFINNIHIIWGLLSGPLKAVWNTLSGWFSAVWGAFSAFIGRRWHTFINNIHIIWGLLAGPLKATWRGISGWFSSTWNAFAGWVGRKWTSITDKITGALSAVGRTISGIWTGIKNTFTHGINGIINDVINPFIRFINGIPGVSIPQLGNVGGGGGGKGGGSVSSGAAKGQGPLGNGTLRNAAGGRVHPGQRSWVGERGPEIMQALPGGGVRIYPHAESLRLAQAMGEPIPGFSVGGFFGAIGHAAKWTGDKVWTGAKDVGSGVQQLGTAAVKAILHGAESAANTAIKHLPGGGFVHDMAHGIVGRIVNDVESWIGGKGKKKPPAGAIGDTGARSGSAATAQAYAKSVLGQYGWTDAQMSALIQLWNGESGWDAYAVNKSSGAAGIPQALGHGHVFDLGDYKAQIQWGLNYIQGTYGSPSAALSAWQGRSPHWYDSGGVLKPGTTLVHNGTGKPEAVLTAKQWGMLYQAVLDKKRNDKLKEFGYGVTLTGLKRAGQAVAGAIAHGMTENSSVQQIRDAAGKVATQIKDVFGGTRRDSLLSYVKDVTKKIADLAGQRDAINSQLAAARSLRETVSSNVGGSGALTGITDPTNTYNLISGMRDVYNKVKAFGNNIKIAARKGLSTPLLNQLTGEGYETGGDLAKLLARSSPAQIKKLSQLQGAINYQSGKIGDTVVNAEMGGTVARSFVDGLNRQKGALNRQMDALARRFANTMAHQLSTPASLKAMGVSKAELIAAKARKYDTGGALHPGLTLAYNATGRTETVLTDTQMRTLESRGSVGGTDQVIHIEVPVLLKGQEIGRAAAEYQIKHQRPASKSGR